MSLDYVFHGVPRGSPGNVALAVDLTSAVLYVSNPLLGQWVAVSNSGIGNGRLLADNLSSPPSSTAPLQAYSGQNPFLWLYNAATSKWEDFAGIETQTKVGSGSSLDSIQLEFYRPVVVSDGGPSGAHGIKNALFSVTHMSGATTATGTETDDRAITWLMMNSATPTPAYGQYLGVYAETHIQNPETTCAPANTETPAGGLRQIIIDERVSGTPISGGLGIVALSGVCYGSAGFDTPVTGNGYSGVFGVYQNSNIGNLSGSVGAGVAGMAVNFDAGLGRNGTGIALFAHSPLSGNRFEGTGGTNIGVYISSFQSDQFPKNDFNIYSVAGGVGQGQNYFQGPVVVVSDIRVASAGGSAPGNTDTAGQLTLSGGTTSYTFKNTFNTQSPIAVASWTGVGILTGVLQVSCTKTTLTISSTVNSDTAQVSYICVARN